MTDRVVPASLLSVVERDLRPVRPLASPGRRALAVAPVGLVLLVGMPLFWYWRNHLAQLAPWPAWPLSPLETAIGLVTPALGFGEPIPGRELPRMISSAAIAAVWIGFLAINAVRAMPSTEVPAETTLRWIAECVAMVTAFSLPALAIPIWLVARALPRRPALTGALCGLGVGMMADAGLRLFCWDGDTLHIVIAHGGAMAIVMALGAASGAITERIKARR